MPQPQGSAEWAENAVYASPGDPWDGNPTKVQPPAGKTAEGYEPTEEVAAQFVNDWPGWARGVRLVVECAGDCQIVVEHADAFARFKRHRADRPNQFILDRQAC